MFAPSSGHADRAEDLRVIEGKRALSGLGFADRNASLRGEARQRFRSFRINHAAAGDDQRPFGRTNPLGSQSQQLAVATLAGG